MAYQLIKDLICKGSICASQVLPFPINLQLLLRQLLSSDSLPHYHAGAFMTLVTMVRGDHPQTTRSHFAGAL